MESPQVGELVRVAGGGPQLNGIVFDVPSRSKVVVAVLDRSRGPVFRTVHPDELTERADAGPDDHAINLLLKRTPSPSRGSAAGGTSAVRGRAGHARGAMHRTTGK
jgi:hypothetical protein